MSEHELPRGWLVVTGADCAVNPKDDIVDGPFGSNLKSSEYVDEGVPLVRIQNVKRFNFVDKNIRCVTAEKAQLLKRHTFISGDILITKLGDPLGLSCIVPNNIKEGVIVADLVRFRSDDDLISKKLLMYYLNSDLVIKQLELLTKGTTRPRVNLGVIRSLSINLAPFAEQQQIAAKLDELLAQVDSLKTRLDAIPKILKRFRQSVLAAAVSGKLTEDWRDVNSLNFSLDDFCLRLKNSEFKKKFKIEITPSIDEDLSWLSLPIGGIFSFKSGDGLIAKEMNLDGGIPVYGGNGVNGFHNESNIPEGTILIGRVGYYCGSVHRTKVKAWATDNALVVNFPKEVISPDFVYWLLTSTNLREEDGATAQPVISGSKLYPIMVKLPRIEEQAEIVRRVEQFFDYADQIELRVKDAKSRVNHLTQSILAKAFRGELTAEWREQNPDLISGDNSAEALLARIRAERDAKGKLTGSRRKKIDTLQPDLI